LPTLIDLCGLKKPEGVKLDGASLAPLLTGEGANWPERTLLVHSQRIEHPKKWRKSAVMTDRWRLVNGKELYDVKADPGQKTNVAGENAEVVATLRKAYDAWWGGLSKRFGEYCEIIIGSEHENPSRITCYDWHGASVPWHQGAVRRGGKANGFWAVEVARDGKYEFELRRWPKEVNQSVEAEKARLKIGDVDETQAVPAGATAATFTVQLQAGKTRMQTWLTGGKAGKGRGAYFVYVKRL